ncbi:tripartite tricarboxylate transporter TctB family protein [Limimaricola cinnabarinus]|uniref:tripartite tricarboxylate transporter TctB family protein n=1 Tax=Limimaricola cinnabarinus TaxID=1125964 RepID=UPI002FE2B11C
MTGLSLRNDWFEQAFLLLVMLAGAASVKAGLAMPSSPWEVIGKGAFPTALGGLALGLGALKMLGALRRDDRSEGRASDLSWRIPAAVLLMACYVAVLASGGIHYVASTGVFCFAFFLLLAPSCDARKVAGLALLSAGYATAVFVIFTRFFFINL